LKTYDVPRLLALLEIDAKRSGREYQAKCPFHHDNDPSWHIEETSGMNFCFGCTEGGGPAFLVMRVLGVDILRARGWLKENAIENDSAFAVPGEVSIKIGGGFVKRPAFTGLPSGVSLTIMPQSARHYLDSRGITDAQIYRWDICYGFSGELVDRVVFPILDQRGFLQGFMARTVVGARPRYTTPRPESNSDRTVIFGERWWPEDVSKSQVVVTEGAINALACERAGAKCIAALGGSNPGLTVYTKLSKFKQVIVASDPDKAGERVASALKVLQRWTDVTRVELPPGLDAADLSSDALRSRLVAAGLQ
jgi:DNA primase